MRIIISPAKKMNTDTDTFAWQELPVFLDKTEQLLGWMREQGFEKLKKLWGCSDRIAESSYDRIMSMELRKHLTPALISYEGIQYQYMAPGVFSQECWDYVQEHLRILSGFYGVLRPLDGVTPYRLEMQAKAKAGGAKDLYGFWEDLLYREMAGHVMINLASKEYSRCIEKYLRPEDVYITCVFGEEKDGKVRQKGTLAKMARGEMVRFMAENRVENPEEMKEFRGLDFHYEAALSTEREYVFLRKPDRKDRGEEV